jgi:hypothetical protein
MIHFFFAKIFAKKKIKKNLEHFSTRSRMNKLLVLALVVGVFGTNNGKAVGNPYNGNNGNDNGRGNSGGKGPQNNGGGGSSGNPGKGPPQNNGGGENHENNPGKGPPHNNGGENPGVPVVPVVTPPPATHSTNWMPLFVDMLIADQIVSSHTDNRVAVPWCKIGKPLRDEFNDHIYCGRRFVDCPLGSQCVRGIAVNIGMCCPSVTSVEIAPKAVPMTTVVLAPVFIAKCVIGSPWKDVYGLEFYCGPPAFGMQQVNCPLGSRCETPDNNAYFACCSV